LKDENRPELITGMLAVLSGRVDRLLGISPRHFGTGDGLHKFPLGRCRWLLELRHQVIVAEVHPSLVAMSVLQDHHVGRNQRLDCGDIAALQRPMELLK